MKYIVGFGRFWWDFIIGEDWKIAAGVALVLAGGAILVAYTGLSDTTIALLAGGAIMAVATLSIVGGALASIRSRT
jgi:hypothetical protein